MEDEKPDGTDADYAPSFEELLNSIKDVDDETQKRIQKHLTRLEEIAEDSPRARLLKTISTRWPEQEEEIADGLRPILLIRLSTDGSPPALGASKVGGVPDLPVGVEWPLGFDDGPVAFVAQINFAECQGLEGCSKLPAQGLLYMFCTTDRADLFEGEPECAVLIGDDPAVDLKPVDPPEDLDEDAEVFTEIGLEFEQGWTLDPSSLPGELFEEVEKSLPRGQGQILGTPRFHNEDLQDGFDPERDELLLALNAFGVIRRPGDIQSIYGGGAFYLVVGKQCLANGDLEDMALLFDPGP